MATTAPPVPAPSAAAPVHVLSAGLTVPAGVTVPCPKPGGGGCPPLAYVSWT